MAMKKAKKKALIAPFSLNLVFLSTYLAGAGGIKTLSIT